jgi:hypothetical protein
LELTVEDERVDHRFREIPGTTRIALQQNSKSHVSKF